MGSGARDPGLGALVWPRLLDVNEMRVLLLATGVPRVYRPQPQGVASGRGYQPCALAGQAGSVYRKTTLAAHRSITRGITKNNNGFGEIA